MYTEYFHYKVCKHEAKIRNTGYSDCVMVYKDAEKMILSSWSPRKWMKSLWPNP